MLAAAVLVTTTWAPASADPGDVGIEGLSHVGTGTPTGTKRAESVLWFNDGSWWGNLWDTATSDFHIFRLDMSTQTWIDTKTTTETRSNTHSDVLWDAGTGVLYIASHQFVADGVPATPNFPAKLFRYSYNAATQTYTQLGIATTINNYKTETLVIEKDSTGRVWATWAQDDRIYLNVTATDGSTWGTPFPHPTAPPVSGDDNASLIAFGSSGAKKIGAMWSSELGDSTDGFYWSVHDDGAASNSWTPASAVISGYKIGDDHINIKWLDSSGARVFAAVKTSFTKSAEPLLLLLSLNNGTWTKTTIATVSECPNRVILLIDETQQRLRTFATYPKPAGTTNAGTCTTSGGAIYEKSTPLSNISFTTTKTARIVDADEYVHNVSSTKQNVTSSTGLVVIADVNSTYRYWHYAEAPAPVDTTPPDTTIDSGPSGTVTSGEATFTFSSEAGATFGCSLDSASFVSCTAPVSYSGLSEGSHTFSVRATDTAGNTDQTAATQTWTVATPAPVDTTPPDTTIDSGPSGTVTSGEATFTFSSEAGATFGCSLDSASFVSCTAPVSYSGLSEGSHTFSVRATDTAGNTDQTAATQTWTVATPAPVDTTPPDTTIDSGPSGTVTSGEATFTFSSEAGATFGCSLDSASFVSCTAPVSYSGLSEGSHTFSVRATDTAGNTDQTAATQTWTVATPAPVDTTPPDTTIDSGPSGTVTSGEATFTFSSEAGATFGCSLDSASFVSCTAPVSYSGLSEGSHTFSVRATDTAGNTDQTAATQTWTVATPASSQIVRQSFSTALNPKASTTLRIDAPAGVAVGDILVSCVSLPGGLVESGGVPAGWTELAAVTSLQNPRVYGYYKVATATEPTAYVWTTSSVPGGGAIVRYSGASGLDTAVSSASGAAAASGTVGQVTTTTSGAMLVGCMSADLLKSTFSSPSGMTEVVEGGQRRFEVADGSQSTAGASGSKTWTFNAPRDWAGWLVALRPK